MHTQKNTTDQKTPKDSTEIKEPKPAKGTKERKERKKKVVGGLGLAVVAVVTVGLQTSTPLAQSNSPSRTATGAAQGQGQATANLPLSSGRWNTFVADVSVRTTHVGADGTPLGVPAEPMRYRWERSQSGAGWKTVMTIADRSVTVGSGATRQTVANRFAVARIEDDEDGSPLRMYGTDGQRITPPSLADLQRWTDDGLRPIDKDNHASRRGSDAQPGGLANGLPNAAPSGRAGGPQQPGAPRRFVGSAERDWVNAFVATPEQKGNRRTRLAQQLVRSGQLRGLDRFTHTDGGTTHEVLVDPQSAVPVEVNTLHDGRLASHQTVTYQSDASGALVRRAVHAEHVLSPAGERAVTDTEYTNVHVEERTR